MGCEKVKREKVGKSLRRKVDDKSLKTLRIKLQIGGLDGKA